jgi:hypothetical protein
LDLQPLIFGIFGKFIPFPSANFQIIFIQYPSLIFHHQQPIISTIFFGYFDSNPHIPRPFHFNFSQNPTSAFPLLVFYTQK